MSLSSQLDDALAEWAMAKPGEKRERKDGYIWQKQRSGAWKRLHKAAGRKAGAEEGAAVEAASKAMNAKDAPVPKGRIWIDHVPGLPNDTQKAHIDTETGDYKPERKALHRKIIEGFLAGNMVKGEFVPAQVVPEGHQPETLFMMGTTASGKSSARREVDPDPFKKFGVVEVDPDAIKAMLPEYQKSISMSARDAAKITHEESSDIADQIRKLALEQNKNILVDGTGKTLDTVEKKIKEAKARGHHISALMPHVPLDQCKERADDRAEKKGRYVPHFVIEKCAEKVGKNFMALKDTFDTFTLFDNRTLEGGKRKPPTPIMKKPPEPPKVIDSDYFKLFLRESGITMEWIRSKGNLMTEQDQEKMDSREGPPPKKKRAVDPEAYDAWFINTIEAENAANDAEPADYKVGEGVEEVLGD